MSTPKSFILMNNARIEQLKGQRKNLKKSLENEMSSTEKIALLEQRLTVESEIHEILKDERKRL